MHNIMCNCSCFLQLIQLIILASCYKSTFDCNGMSGDMSCGKVKREIGEGIVRMFCESWWLDFQTGVIEFLLHNGCSGLM